MSVNTLITAKRGCEWLSQGKSAHLCKLLAGYSQKFREINVRSSTTAFLATCSWERMAHPQSIPLPVDFSSTSGKMQIMKCVAVLLGITLTAYTSAAAQECKETARGQIEAVLDKSTNRILLSEVVNDFGEEGKRVLVEIAGDESQSSRRRGEAIRLLGEYRSDAGERLLLEMLRDHKTACGAINALQEYRSPEIVPAFIALLDDHRSCGNIVRFNAGGQGKQNFRESSPLECCYRHRTAKFAGSPSKAANGFR